LFAFASNLGQTRRVIRQRKALVLGAALVLVLAFAASASAKKVSFTGEGKNLQPGQTKGLSVLMGFELVGKGCPSGPKCFDHARVQKLNAVSWAYPNCPEVLDGLWELNGPYGVGKNKPHRFSGSGSSEQYAADHVTIKGRFSASGRTARGWFTVEDAGCSTGKINWIAHPD
jgi:hypothetical protein